MYVLGAQGGDGRARDDVARTREAPVPVHILVRVLKLEGRVFNMRM